MTGHTRWLATTGPAGRGRAGTLERMATLAGPRPHTLAGETAR